MQHTHSSTINISSEIDMWLQHFVQEPQLYIIVIFISYYVATGTAMTSNPERVLCYILSLTYTLDMAQLYIYMIIYKVEANYPVCMRKG